jgi:long-chain acyl-CoA synthetase
MHWLAKAQHGFYDRVLKAEISGRGHVPYNRNVMVVANHASHLDMGLVKYALGSFGKNLASLAAQDYFFEGNRWRRAYFENLTHLVPVDRGGSLRDSLRQAGALLDAGRTVLVFPEATRGRDDQVREFRPAVGHLALEHGVDILPVWLGNTHAALPKGARWLRRRDVMARIGPVLEILQLRRLTDALPPGEASRVVANLAERAVRELSQGRVLDLTLLEPTVVHEQVRAETLTEVFEELRDRFQVGSVEQPVSYYFSLGNGQRWTVKIDRDSCEVLPGKVASPADCVLKTSPAMFTRIVREAYTPTPAEFMAGTVKSNNISLLLTFQKAFQLSGER